MRKRQCKLTSVQEFIVTGYRNGSTLRELAHIYNVSPNTVKNFLQAKGESLRSPGRKKLNKAQPTGAINGIFEQA